MIAQLIGLALVLVSGLALAVISIGQRRNRIEKLSAVPAFHEFSGEVGRVAEEGAAIHVALGSGDYFGEQGLVGLGALQGLKSMMSLAAAYDTPPYVSVGDPILFLVAENQLRDAYARQGNVQTYRPGFVQYMPPGPVLYAAMASALTLDEPVATQITLGSFNEEAALLANAARRSRATVLGGAAAATGIAALVPTVAPDQLIMGEQLFAGGAENTGRSADWASLKTEDLLRWIVIIGILVAAGLSLFGIGG